MSTVHRTQLRGTQCICTGADYVYYIREPRPAIVRELFIFYLKNDLIYFLQNKTLTYKRLEKYVQALTK